MDLVTTKAFWLIWIIEATIVPIIGPTIQIIGCRAYGRNDYTELGGVLIWPVAYFAISAYTISFRKRRTESVVNSDKQLSALQSYSTLAHVSALSLCLFEGASVISISMYFFSTDQKMRWSDMAGHAAVFYAGFVVAGTMARSRLRAACSTG
jgi:hypothetical protein